MGVFTWPMRIASLDGENAHDMEAVVDTGTSFSIVPARLLRDLGIVPTRKGVFYLADDRPVEWDVGEARTTVDGISGVTPVIFGEDDAEPLLGAVTLQILQLGVDPSEEREERLVPRCSRF